MSGVIPAADWYKDAVIYELHVKSFCDSNGDGIGDFRGLTSKLPYLKDLGVTALWLLPFYPSPLRDDGYDIADYYDVHPQYGTLADFKHFLKVAKKLDLRVITELVINHTSDAHPWFLKARTADKKSKYRDFYVWSDSTEKYKEARIIFKDFETSNWTWDKQAGAYYWHRFYSHQPDLNFENPEVIKAVTDVMDFWLAMGVDGMRLDAIPYLFEEEGTSCENLPQTHQALKKLRAHVDAHHQGKMLLAEANQWPEDAVKYFGQGDECHMSFHFPLMPRLFMALHMEDYFPIQEILDQTPAIPENCQWALFLRNHDELTLEMVTDEERDYMYRVYAHDAQARINLGIRRRLSPLLGNDRRKMELMKSLLLSLPGTPVVYYGDEIGMGDNIYLGDRNGVRMPMQWNGDRNAGFSSCNPQQLFLPVNVDPQYHFETVNVEAQQSSPHSFLWWTKRLIALRKQYQAFGRGQTEFLNTRNRKILCYMRSFGQENILVVANLSRFSQYVELDLKQHSGCVPVEMFGGTAFPAIGELPYLLSLGPHSFYWFELTSQNAQKEHPKSIATTIALKEDSWETLFEPRYFDKVRVPLMNYLNRSRMYYLPSKVKELYIRDRFLLAKNGRKKQDYTLLLLEVQFADADPQLCWFAVGNLDKASGSHLNAKDLQEKIICHYGNEKIEDALLYEATDEDGYIQSMMSVLKKKKELHGAHGTIELTTSMSMADLDTLTQPMTKPLPRSVFLCQVSRYIEDKWHLLLYTKALEGMSPSILAGQHFYSSHDFEAAAHLQGYISYRSQKGRSISVGVIHAYLHSRGSARQEAVEALERYHENLMTRKEPAQWPDLSSQKLLDALNKPQELLARQLMGPYLERMLELGSTIGRMHVSFARSGDTRFSAEPLLPVYQRSLYQSMRNHTETLYQYLGSHKIEFDAYAMNLAENIPHMKQDILKIFHQVTSLKITAMRLHSHGDLRLDNIFCVHDKYYIGQLDGDTSQSYDERMVKRCVVRDIATILSSLRYVAWEMSVDYDRRLAFNNPMRKIDARAQLWFQSAASEFMQAYIRSVVQEGFWPKNHQEASLLLDIYMLERAICDLTQDLKNEHLLRCVVPLSVIHELVAASK